jgi:hypothetical protein
MYLNFDIKDSITSVQPASVSIKMVEDLKKINDTPYDPEVVAQEVMNFCF